MDMHAGARNRARIKFDHVLCWLAWAKTLWIGVRVDILLNVHYLLVRVEPDHIKREIHTLHPKTLCCALVEHKKHTMISQQRRPIAQALLLRLRRSCNFQYESLTVYLQYIRF